MSRQSTAGKDQAWLFQRRETQCANRSPTVLPRLTSETSDAERNMDILKPTDLYNS